MDMLALWLRSRPFESLDAKLAMEGSEGGKNMKTDCALAAYNVSGICMTHDDGRSKETYDANHD